MKRRGSLTLSILGITMLNVLVLAGAFTLFVMWQLRQEFESFLLAGGGERLLSLARDVSADLERSTRDRWDELLAGHAGEGGVALQLVTNDGTRLAGAAIDIPAAVHERLRPILPGAPPPRRGGGGFVPGFEPPAGDGRGGARGAPPLVQPLFLVRADRDPEYWVGVRMPVRAVDDPVAMPATLLVSSATLVGNPFLFQPAPWIALVAIALGVSAACWLPWISGVTRSVRRMEAATARIAQGDFDVSLATRRNDEVGRLAAGIADMAERIAQLLRSQKRFLSDAAHELRSPVTRMQLALDLIDEQPPEKRAQYLQDLREDVDEMRRICEALLDLGRNELRERVWDDDVEVGGLIARAIRMEARGADVRVDVAPDLRVRGNADQLGRAVGNVLRNAIFYAGSDGPIEIEAQGRPGGVEIAVRDHGPGVPEADLEALFTPFYRLDVARDRRSGGTGLGLAIVRAAVEACGGQVACRNREPRGLEVTMRLNAA